MIRVLIGRAGGRWFNRLTLVCRRVWVVDLSFLGELPPRSVVFWSGAGVSRDVPTGGPLGAELTTRVLARYFDADCRKPGAKLRRGISSPGRRDR